MLYLKKITTILIINLAIILSVNVLFVKSPRTPTLEQQSTITNSTSPKTVPPKNSNKCIVTIKGTKYDVTKLKKTHSGGDIFVCGTDMTNTFFQQHNTLLLDTQMLKYKIQ